MPAFVATIEDPYTKDTFTVTVFAESQQEASQDIKRRCKTYGVGYKMIHIIKRERDEDQG